MEDHKTVIKHASSDDYSFHFSYESVQLKLLQLSFKIKKGKKAEVLVKS